MQQGAIHSSEDGVHGAAKVSPDAGRVRVVVIGGCSHECRCGWIDGLAGLCKQHVHTRAFLHAPYHARPIHAWRSHENINGVCAFQNLAFRLVRNNELPRIADVRSQMYPRGAIDAQVTWMGLPDLSYVPIPPVLRVTARLPAPAPPACNPAALSPYVYRQQTHRRGGGGGGRGHTSRVGEALMISRRRNPGTVLRTRCEWSAFFTAVLLPVHQCCSEGKWLDYTFCERNARHGFRDCKGWLQREAGFGGQQRVARDRDVLFRKGFAFWCFRCTPRIVSLNYESSLSSELYFQVGTGPL